MKRSLLAAASIVGLWAAAAPLVFSWSLTLYTVAASVIPGVLTLQLAALACTLRPERPNGNLDYLLMCRTCSYLVLLGAWLILGPLLLDYPMRLAGTYLGGILPGFVVMGLGLANGHLGWREANPD